jgi:hypothetical protein
MNLAREIARAFIAKQYPGMKFRLTRKATIGVRPVFEVDLGKPVLVWKKSQFDGCRIDIGQLLPGGGINWQWQPERSAMQ